MPNIGADEKQKVSEHPNKMLLSEDLFALYRVSDLMHDLMVLLT